MITDDQLLSSPYVRAVLQRAGRELHKTAGAQALGVDEVTLESAVLALCTKIAHRGMLQAKRASALDSLEKVAFDDKTANVLTNLFGRGAKTVAHAPQAVVSPAAGFVPKALPVPKAPTMPAPAPVRAKARPTQSMSTADLQANRVVEGQKNMFARAGAPAQSATGHALESTTSFPAFGGAGTETPAMFNLADLARKQNIRTAAVLDRTFGKTANVLSAIPRSALVHGAAGAGLGAAGGALAGGEGNRMQGAATGALAGGALGVGAGRLAKGVHARELEPLAQRAQATRAFQAGAADLAGGAQAAHGVTQAGDAAIRDAYNQARHRAVGAGALGVTGAGLGAAGLVAATNPNKTASVLNKVFFA